MKILVTGAGGMLGSDLVSHLMTKYELVGVGRNPAPHLGIPFEKGDLASVKFARDVIRSTKPQIILHAAAMTDVDRCETHRAEALRGNLEATRNVAEASRGLGALVIFFSTDFVFDGSKTGPYEETDVPRPINVYGESKLLAERYLFFKGKRFLILRTSWLFGKEGNNFPKKILKQAKANAPLQVVSDQVGNPTFAGDLAEGVGKIVKFFDQPRSELENQIYHIANEGVVSRYEFARAILRKRNYPLHSVTPISSKTLTGRPAARPLNSSLSTEKLKTRLGICLRHWEEALESYLQEDTSLSGAGKG